MKTKWCFGLVAFTWACWLWIGSDIRAGYSIASDARQQQLEDASRLYLPVTGPCNPAFPRDHGPHPGFRNEWWYYTGNVQAATGEHFGFQLTFFRRQISSPGSTSNWPQSPSDWRTDQIYFAHAALSEMSASQFHQSEVLARGAMNLAGSFQQQDTTTVFVGNWRLRCQGREHHLRAASERFRMDLLLNAGKEPVAHGLAGYSRKGSTPEQASCYYSITRLTVSGTVAVGAREIPVEGIAWMDHEYGSASLEPNLMGWDWFSLQLKDNTELMLYLLRQEDGNNHPSSSGTYVDAGGQAHHLPADAFTVEVLDSWVSSTSGARYPHRWRVRIPEFQLDLLVIPALDNQEMVTTRSAGTTYWEGAVTVTGTNGSDGISGVGYVELTGYAGPMRLE
ncbi:MAG TPA: carotenoid 1,2-hydratase [Syntrophobacteraceae bacterium]|nr:carotenoid 1,2-hydratase [Syntrophobacteraceae bacterium]